MFKPASMQRTFTLCSSYDPALALPEVPVLPADAPADLVVIAKAAADERARQYKVALDHCRWPDITKPGEVPTLFGFRQIHADLSWLRGEVARRSAQIDEQFELAFRLAIVSIENMSIPIKLAMTERTSDGQKYASKDCLAPLYDIGFDIGQPELGRAVMQELGAIVVERAIQGVRPLS